MSNILAVSAYGDAVGAPYEMNNNKISFKENNAAVLKGYNLFRNNKGQWSDDTYMAHCITMALKVFKNDYESEGFYDLVAQLFYLWATEDGDGIGIQTNKIMKSLKKDGRINSENMRSISKKYFKKKPNTSAGNGCLMRTHPIVLAQCSLEEKLVMAKNISQLTHFDERCYQACVLWIAMLDHALQTSNIMDRFDPFVGLPYIEKANREEWKNIITEALTKDSNTFSKGGWWVIPTFQQALSAVHHNLEFIKSNPDRVFQEIIKDKKSDTDTVCAIAGGLMGALGTTVDDLDEDNVKSIYGNWPEKIVVKDLIKLEEELRNSNE